MHDYIDRGAFKEKYEVFGWIEDMPAEEFDKFPAADVRPVVHARWEPEDDVFDDSTWCCSACHEPWTLIAGTPEENGMHFCPNCGAKMDGGDIDD